MSYWAQLRLLAAQAYVLFSDGERHKVVMAARIDKIIDAPGKPAGRSSKAGVPEGHAGYQAYVGLKKTPSMAWFPRRPRHDHPEALAGIAC